jgi:hypothetical protein
VLVSQTDDACASTGCPGEGTYVGKSGPVLHKAFTVRASSAHYGSIRPRNYPESATHYHPSDKTVVPRYRRLEGLCDAFSTVGTSPMLLA